VPNDYDWPGLQFVIDRYWPVATRPDGIGGGLVLRRALVDMVSRSRALRELEDQLPDLDQSERVLLVALVCLHDLEGALYEVSAEVVAENRAAGTSWEMIGAAMGGVGKTAAQKRFGARVAEARERAHRNVGYALQFARALVDEEGVMDDEWRNEGAELLRRYADELGDPDSAIRSAFLDRRADST
jgi:hypothetical protein